MASAETSNRYTRSGYGSLRVSPVVEPDSRLAQNLFHKRSANHSASMWVRDANFERSLLHELVAPAGNRSGESQAPEPFYQFAAGDRAHLSGCLHWQTDPPHAGNGVAIANLQDQPLFQDLLEHFLAPFQRGLVRPDAGYARDLPEICTIRES